MATRRENAEAALRSQRRFLIFTSIAVAGYYALSVHLKGEGEYSGLAITIEHPGRIPYMLWVVFVWSFLRYCQQLNQQWLTVRRKVMKEFQHFDRQLILKAASKSAIAQVKERQLAKDLRDPYVDSDAWLTPSIKEIARKTIAQRQLALGKPMPKRVSQPWFLKTKGGRDFSGREFGIAVVGEKNNERRGYDFKMPPWSRTRTLMHLARAWARTALRLPAILEYLSPLLIALLAVLVAVTFKLLSVWGRS